MLFRSNCTRSHVNLLVNNLHEKCIKKKVKTDESLAVHVILNLHLCYSFALMYMKMLMFSVSQMHATFFAYYKPLNS